MKKIKLPQLLNFSIFLITLLLSLSIQWKPYIWNHFSDSYDYLHQSKLSLCDKEFYSPHKTPDFYPRPFSVPLLYKIANNNPDTIIQLQKIVHSLCTFCLVYVLLLVIKHDVIKYFLILAIYMLMSWWNILGWTIVLLSESLSLSLLFLWIAAFLYFFKKRNTVSLILQIIITLFFSFTRDTWPYIILVFYLLTTLIFYVYDKPIFKKSLILAVFSIFLFFIQHKTAEIGCRQKLPLMNTIVKRIIPSQEYTRWFIAHGMPQADRIVTNLSGIDPNDDIRLHYLYKDTTYKTFFRWAETNGPKTYIKFLLTHPSYTLLCRETGNQRERIFAKDLFYTGDSRGYSKLFSNVFPIVNAVEILILCIISMIIFLKNKHVILTIPVVIMLVFIFNIFLTYNADALEVQRHMVFTEIMIQFIGILTLSQLLDCITSGFFNSIYSFFSQFIIRMCK